jgi:hypothetical protein
MAKQFSSSVYSRDEKNELNKKRNMKKKFYYFAVCHAGRHTAKR